MVIFSSDIYLFAGNAAALESLFDLMPRAMGSFRKRQPLSKSCLRVCDLRCLH